MFREGVGGLVVIDEVMVNEMVEVSEGAGGVEGYPKVVCWW